VADVGSELEAIATERGARSLAIAFYDLADQREIALRADRWYHAASTIKVAILLGVFDAIERGDLVPHSRVHVRNRFLSALDAEPFRVASGRDANAAVHEAIGKTLTVRELAHHMIATSSNLATNLLLDLVGLESVRRTLSQHGLDDGIEVRRGVEDERAYQKGINNRVTASGLARMFKHIAEGTGLGEALRVELIEILLAQEFNSGIPAGLPADARVAHKTGEISTVAHDAGIVYLPNRPPYILVILTEWEPQDNERMKVIAEVARRIHAELHG
jgi:beta-lactamase class A